MSSRKQRIATRVSALREDHPAVDHVVRTFTYYGDRNGNGHAGAVTFYAFLSFFPLLALAFWAVGYISTVAPEVRAELVDAIEAVLPGVIGSGKGQISLQTFEDYAGTIGLIGLAGLLYTGLAWVSAMRRALGEMFQLPEQDRLGFVRGKIRDLVALTALGVVLVVSVSLSGAMTWFSEAILRWVGLDEFLLAELLLWAVAHALAIGATTLLFMALYALVPRPHVARRAMWQGALTGAVGFELLKSAASYLIAYITDRPAFQAFGVALVLLVWINYFSRLVMLSASWAYTAPVAEELRTIERAPLVSEEEIEMVEPAPAAVVGEDRDDGPVPVAAGDPAGHSGSRLKGRAVAALTRLRRRRRH